MNSRLIASLAVGAAVILGATGCSMISPQATTIPYSPSDGVDIKDAGPILVRNALIVANEEGTAGNLVAAIINDSDKTETLNIEIGEGADAITETVRVPANSRVSLGSEDTDPLLFDGIDSEPGSDLPVYFQSGDAEGVLAAVPVLDGTLEYLSHLVPEVEPTPEAEPAS